jgi:hypothetical protein
VPYASLYRAKAVSIRSGTVEAFVPQVFGETTVTITDFLGTAPSAPTMGWVFFQAGNPEFPVWSSGLGVGSAGGGNGNGDTGDHSIYDEVWIGPTAPPAAQEMWFDSNEPPNGVLKVLVNGNWQTVTSGSTGTGTDEVWVGPNAPTDVATELWVDTDDPATLSEDTRWNTAWGEVYYAETPSNTANLTTTPALLIPQIDLVGLTLGRKLRITVWGGTGPTVSTANSELYLAIADASSTILRRARGFNPTSNTKAGPGVMIQHRVNTTVSTFSFRVMGYVQAGTGVWSYSAAIEPITVLVEDIGPVSGAVAAPNPTPAWLPLSYAASWSALTNGAAYRKIGDIVYVQGGVQWSGGSVASGTQTVCTLPAGYRPPATRRFVAWLNNTGVAIRCSVDTAGVVTLDTALTNLHSWEINLIFSVTP